MAQRDAGMSAAPPGIRRANPSAAVPAIVDVWRDNLDEAFARIIHIVEKHPFVAMDTEFPGIVARPVGAFESPQSYHYQIVKCNVDVLNIIQLGLTFYDEQGRPLPPPSTYQFNFRFDLNQDMYSQDSITLLQRAGLDFARHASHGITPMEFITQLFTSGLVLSEDVTWITFHSGYDFGYLLALLRNKSMPEDEGEFFEALLTYFPRVVDVKYLAKSVDHLSGGLALMSEQMQIPRIGTAHQAGSDSRLTGDLFFKLRSQYFEDSIQHSKYNGVVYGLGRTIKKKSHY